ncbi:MAG: Unknown protein [uncultured Sulfurovum sp.]|uniref:beta-lactamase n=1 Tax=uncultured Sulfurovum sp. TaxID=269237 RepID=A0A6S6TET5_9BACT|nr:MAG: Unknown protein [uncultured Sulfurovum sp.]
MKQIILGLLVLVSVTLLSAKTTIVNDINVTKSIEKKEDDQTKIVQELTRKCEEKNATACFKVGIYTLKGQGVKADGNESFVFFHKACDLNESTVCTRLAMTYENNESIRYDINQSIALYKKACDLKNVRACDALGYLYTKEHGALKADNNLSVQYFMKTCELADYTCEKIATAYELGKGLKQNTDNAIQFYEKACENNATQACSKLGRLYLEKNTYKKAQIVLTKACEAKDHWSCSQLGYLYEKGVEDITKDNNKSLISYDKACNLGSRTSCSKLGMDYLIGKGKQKDTDKALVYLSKACDKADAKACALIASMYLKGDGVSANKIKALSFSDRACRFGDKSSCK